MRHRLPVCRLAPLVGLLALLLALHPHAAGAGGWCRADPVFEVGGRVGRVYVSAPEAMLEAASGPVQVVVTAPRGVPTRLLSTDDGFGHGYDVAFREHRGRAGGNGDADDYKVVIAVRAPTRGGAALPVAVEIVADDGTVTAAEGMSGRWVVVRASL